MAATVVSVLAFLASTPGLILLAVFLTACACLAPRVVDLYRDPRQ